VKFKIPYGKHYQEINIPSRNLLGILQSRVHNYRTNKTQEEIVESALDNPIGSPTLEQLAKEKKNIVIITSDHTRPVPSKITLPILLRRIRGVNPQAEIKILIATGFHRPSTRDEMINKFGPEIVNKEIIINHECDKKEDLVYLGLLPSGGDLWLNRLAIEADLLIAEGFIEPHFFAGFSGGRKSILPGIAGRQTVLANHCSEFIASEYARTGVLEGNPIHKDMLYAAEKAGLAFILNVVLDGDKNIINAFAGHRQFAHEAGCAFVSELARVPKLPADIVVTSNGGYPLDQNIYQAVKGMSAAEASCKKGGVIIIISACNDGHGGESFYRNLAEAKSPEEVTEKVLKIARNDTMPDQWEFQILARILTKHQVILVTDQCDKDLIESMHFKHAVNFEEALETAFKLKGQNATITLIPDGVSVIVS